jgi:PAS domain S-box-containing protein
MLRNQSFYTGVAENIDMPDTLKTAIQLMPDIRKFIVYGSWNTTYFENMSLLKQVVSENNLPVEIQQIENTPISRMLAHVPGLKNDVAVLFLSQVLDDDGKMMPITKSIQIISQASPVPVLSFWDFTLGNGALGGKLVSGQSQGETAAHLALQILNGENVKNIPVIEKSPNRFMFDYVQLKRFSIPISALPENSLVINQPESFFNRNKTAVLTILSILCCLVAIIGILSAAIMRRKQAETLLRRSDTKHRAMIANISDVIAIVDINGINRYKSPNIERWFGWRPDDVVGVSTWENVHPDDLERMQVFFGALMDEPNTTGKTECRYRCKDRSYKWIEVTAVNLLHVPDIIGVLLNYHDITESKQAEKALRKSEEKFRLIFEYAPLGILHFDNAGVITTCNDNFVKIIGSSKESLIGLNMFKLKDERIVHTLQEALQGRTASFEGNYHSVTSNALVSAKTTPVHVLFGAALSKNGDVEGGTGIIEDITKRKQAEEEKAKLEGQLQRAQKMESIGSLAGGIAHDLNNILFPISGLAEMLLDDIPPDTPEHKSIEQIHKSAIRGSDLVKQILSFSRQSNPQKLPIRIQPILKEALKLAQATIPRHIEITSHINTDCGMVSADPTQIHQIAMNLITNAFHSVEQTGGMINIAMKETAIISFGEKDERSFHAVTGGLLAGRYACITVSDTGTGIDKTLIDKIFDPYFTTKELGKGTGLGLSVVHGIIKEHGGDIRVYSEVGKGTAFHVYLPLIEDAGDSKPGDFIRKCPTGCERILLVDDEEPIVLLEQMMLKRLGYQVTALTSSQDALAAFKANPGNFDLVISDKSMPNMTGEQLAMEIISIKPLIPIIICTGFSDENDVQRAKAMGVKGFLMKPVAMGDLAEMVRKLLNEVADSTLANEKKEAF